MKKKKIEMISQKPTWELDENVFKCNSCYVDFTILVRRHHCRNCGKIFCANCSNFKTNLFHLGYMKPERVNFIKFWIQQFILKQNKIGLQNVF